MALPTVITDLSITAASNSPAGSDSIGTSLDDYLRIIQVFVKQLFNTGVIYSDTVGGTADIITLTPTPALTVYKAGQGIAWIVSGANTTNVTVNVSGLGAKALTKSGATALSAGDLPSGALAIAVSDGTRFQILNLTSNANPILVSPIITTSINDTSNNELLKFTGTASAVNELTVINNATGNYPRIEATGGDTNIGIDFRAKGSGLIRYLGTTTASGGIAYFEQTTNGSNSVTIKAPAAVTTDYTLTLPATAPASKKAVQVAADGTVTFDGDIPSSPIKAWVNFTSNGSTCTVVTGSNVTSVTRNGTGDYTINFTTTLADANYIVTGGGKYSGANGFMVNTKNGTTPTTSAVNIVTWGSNNALLEVVNGYVAIIGN